MATVQEQPEHQEPPQEVRAALGIIGAGALGQTYAGLLVASGQAVTLLASEATAARLLQAGRVRLTDAVRLDAPTTPAPAPPGAVGVTSRPADLPWGAGLLFATKGQQLGAAIAAVRRAWPAPSAEDVTSHRSWVAGVQNGLAKDDLLVRGFGREYVVGAATILSAQRDEDGHVRVTSLGMTYLGEFDGAPSSRVDDAVQALRRSGLPVEAAANIRSVLWSKVCHATGVIGVSTLTRGSGASIWSSPDLVRAYRSLIQETAAVAAAHGVALGDYSGFPIRSYLAMDEAAHLATAARMAGARTAPAGAGGGSPSPPPRVAQAARAAQTPRPPVYPSMTQDLLAGRPLEVDEVFGDIVDRAQAAGIAVPRITLVRDLLRGLDPRGHGA
jgi:2-dehydropantoate 2-reductase